MAWLALVALSILHVLYRLILAFKSWASRFHTAPRPLVSTRPKVPSHVALTLVPNNAVNSENNAEYMLDSVEKVATWCQAVGIPRVTVYDREGTSEHSIDQTMHDPILTIHCHRCTREQFLGHSRAIIAT